jgi:hypothetical protein
MELPSDGPEKSELYSFLWSTCDELRGGMYATPSASAAATSTSVHDGSWTERAGRDDTPVDF